MKPFLCAGVLFLATAGFSLAEEQPFSKSVAPEDFSAAGLSRLSPEELKRLDALVADYKNGVIAAARRSADEAVAAKQAAEAQAKAAKAETAELKKNAHEKAAVSKVTVAPGTKVEIATIKSTIPGRFRGWGSSTIFTLANGQRWQIANGGSYYTPAKQDIEVEITPSTLGGYWMRFPTLDTQVRVKLLTGE